MHAKFTLLERDIIGVGTFRTTYETTLEVGSNPAVLMLTDKIREGVYRELGVRPEDIAKDDAFFIALTVPQVSNLGARVPSRYYMLVITHRTSVTRAPESFRLQIE